MGVMEGESAVQAVYGPALDDARKAGKPPEPQVAEAAAAMREEYEHQLDALYAGARGYVDAIVYPEDTRTMLALALRTTLNNRGPHLGPFVLPARLGTEG
jgi:acetyl-CoA carboxylase carboxyltransferase component